MSKSIGVISGKGGTGKSTVAINLAAAFHESGENTLLVDGNILQPHLGVMLGHSSPDISLHDVLCDKNAFTQAVNYHPTGLKIVMGARGEREGKWNFNQFRKYSSAADVVIFDSSPSFHQHVLDAVDQVMVVTDCSRTSLIDARDALVEAKLQHKVVLGVVVNKYNSKKHPSLEELEHRLGYPVVATLSENDEFLVAEGKKTPHYWLYPSSEDSKAIGSLAARVLCKPYVKRTLQEADLRL